MATRKKKNNPQKLFAKLVKITRKRFDKDPNLKRSYNETQKWVSKNLYPFFKGQSASRVSINQIQDAIESILSTQKPKSVCGNVFLVPDGDIEEQNWWEFFDNLRKIDISVNVRLNAGSFGVSSIMPSGQLSSDQESANIISEIRSGSNNKSGRTIIGFRRVMPGKKDDGDPCSYFIDFILSENGKLVDDASDEVFITEEQSEEAILARRERLKQLKKERTQRARKEKAKKRKRPKSTKEDKEEAATIQERKPSDIRALNAAMKKLESFYDKGLINKKEFKTLLAELIKKFEEGGEV